MRARLTRWTIKLLLIGVILVVGFFIYLVNAWKFNLSEREVDGLITEVKQSRELPEKFYELYNAENDKALDKNIFQTQLPYFIGQRGSTSTSLRTSKQLVFEKKYNRRSHLTAYSLALKLERNTSQKECLNWIASQFDFGFGTIGVSSAANYFFKNELSKLNERELATLVIMLQNSSLYNPIRRKKRVETKVDQLLEKITMANKT